MLAFLTSLLSEGWFGQIVSSIISFFSDRAAYRAKASADMQADLAAHQDDGLKSVVLKKSVEAQLAQLAREDEAADAEIIKPLPKGE